MTSGLRSVPAVFQEILGTFQGFAGVAICSRGAKAFFFLGKRVSFPVGFRQFQGFQEFLRSFRFVPGDLLVSFQSGVPGFSRCFRDVLLASGAFQRFFRYSWEFHMRFKGLKQSSRTFQRHYRKLQRHSSRFKEVLGVSEVL